MAGPTRLELATSCVTGRRSNRLNYGPAVKILDWWAVRDLNTRPSGCKPDALTAELTALTFRFYEIERGNAREKRSFRTFVREFFRICEAFRQMHRVSET
jgi:hypothetical protein